MNNKNNKLISVIILTSLLTGIEYSDINIAGNYNIKNINTAKAAEGKTIYTNQNNEFATPGTINEAISKIEMLPGGVENSLGRFKVYLKDDIDLNGKTIELPINNGNIWLAGKNKESLFINNEDVGTLELAFYSYSSDKIVATPGKYNTFDEYYNALNKRIKDSISKVKVTFNSNVTKYNKNRFFEFELQQVNSQADVGDRWYIEANKHTIADVDRFFEKYGFEKLPSPNFAYLNSYVKKRDIAFLDKNNNKYTIKDTPNKYIEFYIGNTTVKRNTVAINNINRDNISTAGSPIKATNESRISVTSFTGGGNTLVNLYTTKNESFYSDSTNVTHLENPGVILKKGTRFVLKSTGGVFNFDKTKYPEIGTFKMTNSGRHLNNIINTPIFNNENLFKTNSIDYNRPNTERNIPLKLI